MSGISLIAAERARQIRDEGYTASNDDQYDLGQLENAAACYLAAGIMLQQFKGTASSVRESVLDGLFADLVEWPWAEEWLKVDDDPLRSLAKAGALVAAAMDRLLRRSGVRESSILFDFRAHLQRQREFSERTFGPGARTKGVVDHIRKELVEIEENPSDLSEWIDVVILALDGAWRSGASPEEIIAALVAKQTKNEGRAWPDWRTADPEKAITHVRGCAACDRGDFQLGHADSCPKKEGGEG